MSGTVSHPIFARVWARAAPNAASFRDRKELLAGLGGRRVVEIGAGSGTNLPLYEADADVVAVEPEPYLRGRAEDAAASASAAVRVLDATADALPLEDGSVDVAVVSLVLCSVPDQAAALAELRRVLVPGGELRFYEHVVADPALGRGAQRALNLLWPHFSGGCQIDRDTLAAIHAAGFDIQASRRFLVGPLPHVLGRALA